MVKHGFLVIGGISTGFLDIQLDIMQQTMAFYRIVLSLHYGHNN